MDNNQTQNTLAQEKDQANKKRRKKIIIGILLAVIPIAIVICIDWNNAFPNEVIRYTCIFLAIVLLFVGFTIFGINVGNPEDRVFVIAGRVIKNEDIEKAKTMTLKEKLETFNVMGLLLKLLLIPIFFGSMYFIFEDPLHFFEIFESPAKAQIVAVIVMVVIINGGFIVVNRKAFGKTITIEYAVMLILQVVTLLIFMGNIGYVDENKIALSLSEFKSIMGDNGYIISQVDKIENINVENSEIVLAQNNDILIYYIISDKRKNAELSFDSFDKTAYSDCLTGWQASTVGNKKEVTCQNPSYYKTAIQVRNTMIYAKGSLENKDTIDRTITNSGYGQATRK